MHNPAINMLLSAGNCFTTAQAVAQGISRQTLCDYCNSGKLVRMGRGVYLPVFTNNSDFPEIEVLQRKGTDFVLCLFSALKFYNIGTQNPSGIWIAIRKTQHIPRVAFQLECIRCEERYFHALVSTYTLNNLPIKVYSPAKTIADCFKFRNKIGLDVAMEALREAWQKKLFTMDELSAAANICRVERIITPYMEMLVG